MISIAYIIKVNPTEQFYWLFVNFLSIFWLYQYGYPRSGNGRVEELDWTEEWGVGDENQVSDDSQVPCIDNQQAELLEPGSYFWIRE